MTPAPGVPLEDGLLWLAIQDYLGSTQYLNATPELRAAMLQVLAQDAMVRVSTGATDPMGRPASTLRFHAYDRDVTVFVEPTSGDFMAKTNGLTTAVPGQSSSRKPASPRAIGPCPRVIGSR